MLMRFWSTYSNWKMTITSQIPILTQFQITQRCILIQFQFESGSKTGIRRTGSKIEILENVIILEKKRSEYKVWIILLNLNYSVKLYRCGCIDVGDGGWSRVSARGFCGHSIPCDRARSLVFYSWCKSLFLTTYKKTRVNSGEFGYQIFTW